MHQKTILRNISEHRVELPPAHSFVCAKSWKDIYLRPTLREGMIIDIRNESCSRVNACEIRWKDQRFFDLAPFQRGQKGLTDLIPTQALFGFCIQILFHLQTPE